MAEALNVSRATHQRPVALAAARLRPRSEDHPANERARRPPVRHRKFYLTNHTNAAVPATACPPIAAFSKALPAREVQFEY